MTSLALLIAPLMALQSSSDLPVAIENDDPETWTIVYPRPLYRFVEDYRRCLTGQMRRVTGVADFEIQHRSDLVHCEIEFEKAVADGYQRLQQRGDFDDFDAQDVREIFEDIGRIHIARGADLDSQFTFAIQQSEAAQEEYEENKPRGLVLELHDASVVKARTDATAEAAEAAQLRREQETEARGAND